MPSGETALRRALKAICLELRFMSVSALPIQLTADIGNNGHLDGFVKALLVGHVIYQHLFIMLST